MPTAYSCFYLLDNSLLLVEALLGSGGEDTTGGTAKLPGDLLTLGLGRVLLDLLLLSLTDLLGPLGALLLGGVTLGHVLALLFLLTDKVRLGWCVGRRLDIFSSRREWPRLVKPHGSSMNTLQSIFLGP